MSSTAGIKLDLSGLGNFLQPGELEAMSPRVNTVAGELENGSCPGADFLGWLDLPERITEADFAAIETSAARARQDAACYVVIGIGGSYLGARAVLEALGGPADGCPEVLFSGTGLCSATLDRVLARVRDQDFRLCVISKSGTTLEPALAFRLLRNELVKKFGRKEAAGRITAVTDAQRGALRGLADTEGFETYIIPDDVGGRFSVLTPVGLVPLAIAGVDIRSLVDGARAMREACRTDDLAANPAHLYAAARHLLYEKGFTTEVMSTFHGDLQMLQEWWKQLFGESEGKNGHGIFPASTVFTTDLHSMGQYIQDGRRNLQETFLCVRSAQGYLVVPGGDGDNLDGLDYLGGMSLDEINWKAYQARNRLIWPVGFPAPVSKSRP